MVKTLKFVDILQNVSVWRLFCGSQFSLRCNSHGTIQCAGTMQINAIFMLLEYAIPIYLYHKTVGVCSLPAYERVLHKTIFCLMKSVLHESFTRALSIESQRVNLIGRKNNDFHGSTFENVNGLRVTR